MEFAEKDAELLDVMNRDDVGKGGGGGCAVM